MDRRTELRWLEQREKLLRSDLELITARKAELEQEEEEAADLEGLPDMRPISQVCSEVKISRDFLTKLCNSGTVPHIRCGKKVLVNFGELQKYLRTAGRVRA